MLNHALRSTQDNNSVIKVHSSVVKAWGPFKKLLINGLKNHGNIYKATNEKLKLVFRGLSIPLNTLYPNVKKGQTITHGEFLSTSPGDGKKNFGDALGFLKQAEDGKNGNTLITIKNAIGYEVPREMNKGEHEVILLPGSTFKVIQITTGRSDKTDKITLEMIPADNSFSKWGEWGQVKDLVVVTDNGEIVQAVASYGGLKLSTTGETKKFQEAPPRRIKAKRINKKG